MTDAYDASNPHHRKIAHGIEVGDGIPEMRNIKNARDALKSVGFEIIYDEDLADRPDEIVSLKLFSSSSVPPQAPLYCSQNKIRMDSANSETD